MKILVRFPNWIGDAVMATPLLQEIKEAASNASIHVLAKPFICELLKYSPYVEKLIPFDKKEKQAFNFQCKVEKYTHALLLTNSLSSAWQFFRARLPNRIGFANEGRSLFLNHSIPFPKDKENRHLVDVYKLLLPALGIKASTAKPRIFLTDSERKKVQERLEKLNIKNRDIIIGINPGAAYGSAKCWLPERFNKVIAKMLEKNPHLQFLVFGTKEMKDLCAQITRAHSTQVHNLCGSTTIRELVAFINTCDVFLTNDSGPMHIAAACNIPLVALFGSTSPIKTGPYGQGRVLQKAVPCSPCYLRKCPIDFRCMKQIQVEDVQVALERELSC